MQSMNKFFADLPAVIKINGVAGVLGVSSVPSKGTIPTHQQVKPRQTSETQKTHVVLKDVPGVSHLKHAQLLSMLPFKTQKTPETPLHVYLPGECLDDFEERSAIREFDAGMDRNKAELLTLAEILQQLTEVSNDDTRNSAH